MKKILVVMVFSVIFSAPFKAAADEESYEVTVAQAKEEVGAIATDIATDIKYFFDNIDKIDENEKTELFLNIRKKYLSGTKVIKDATNTVLEQAIPEYKEKIGDIFNSSNDKILDFFFNFKDMLGHGIGREASRENYLMRLESCYGYLKDDSPRIALHVLMRNGFRIVRSFEGDAPLPLTIDPDLSLNVRKLELAPPKAGVVEVGGRKALVYAGDIFFPLVVEIEDSSKPSEIVFDIEFTACNAQGICKEYKERVGMILHTEGSDLESMSCTPINTAFNREISPEKSLVSITDAHFRDVPEGIELMVEAEFPTYPHSPFLYIENDFGAKFDYSQLDKTWKTATFMAVLREGDKDKVQEGPLTIVIGENAFAIAQTMSPPLLEDDGTSVSSYIFSGIVFIVLFFAIFLLARLLLKRWLKFVYILLISLLGTMLVLEGIYFASYRFYGEQHELYDMGQVKEMVAAGKIVYVNRGGYRCLPCIYNNIVVGTGVYSGEMIDSGKMVVLRDYLNSGQVANVLYSAKTPHGLPQSPLLEYIRFRNILAGLVE